MLPTFVVIGAMKSGTTSLASYLGAHPQVFMTTPKEPGYFSLRWDHGLDWYEALFASAGDAVARGEASTGYTKAPALGEVPHRMASVIPDAKLVYVVRNPVHRVQSQYVHYSAHRGEARPIDEAVRNNPDYLDFSRYGYQLQLFLEHYDRQQVLIVSSEQLRHDRDAILRRIFEFIGVDASSRIENIATELNRGRDKRRTPLFLERVKVWANRLHIPQLFPMSWRMRVWKSTKVGRIRGNMSASTRRWIASELAEDLERFYEIAGPEIPRWSLDR